MSRLRDWSGGQGLRAQFSLDPDKFAVIDQPLRRKERFSSGLTVIDCHLRGASKMQGISRHCAAGIGDGRHDQHSIGTRAWTRRGHRAAQGQMGVDCRSRRGLPHRRDNRAWQRRHGDHRQCLCRRHHDAVSQAFSKSSTRSRSRPGDGSCSGSPSGFSTSSPGSWRSTTRC